MQTHAQESKAGNQHTQTESVYREIIIWKFGKNAYAYYTLSMVHHLFNVDRSIDPNINPKNRPIDVRHLFQKCPSNRVSDQHFAQAHACTGGLIRVYR